MQTIKILYNKKGELLYKIKKNKKDFIFYIALLFIILLIFIFISSKTYSFLLALSTTILFANFMMIIIKITATESISGISFNTLICYSLVLFTRLTATFTKQNYLPADSSGDWYYQLTELMSFFSIIIIIILYKFRFYETADRTNDTVYWYYLVIPVVFFTFLFKTNLIGSYILDFNWAFSMYLESISIFPQIFLFFKRKGQIESHTTHFIALCGLSRIFSLLFWLDTYKELNEGRIFFSKFSGYTIIGAQFLQILLMADYYYLYFRSFIKKESMELFNI